MDQISGIFENVNWDEVMSLVTEYVTKIDVGAFLKSVIDLFMGLLGEIAGGALGGIL